MSLITDAPTAPQANARTSRFTDAGNVCDRVFSDRRRIFTSSGNVRQRFTEPSARFPVVRQCSPTFYRTSARFTVVRQCSPTFYRTSARFTVVRQCSTTFYRTSARFPAVRQCSQPRFFRASAHFSVFIINGDASSSSGSALCRATLPFFHGTQNDYIDFNDV